MADYHGDMYLFQGLTSLGNKIGDALEKKKEEAKLIKSIKSYAKASGLASQEDIELSDPYALKGFIEGAITKKHLEQQDMAYGMRNMDSMRKLQSDRSMAGFASEFNAGLEKGDAMSAFKGAIQKYPDAAADERFSGFVSAFDKLVPERDKPTALKKNTEYLRDELGVPEDEAKRMAILNFIGRQPGDEVGGLTSASKTEAQKEMAKYESLVGTIGHIQRNMKSSDFGLSGVVGRFKDKWLEQFVTGSADKRRVDVHSAVSHMREQMIAAMKNDSNLSNVDREEITRSLPSLGADESAADASQKLVAAKNLLVRKTKMYSARLGKTPPVWAMEPSEIAEAMKSGGLSQEAAIEAIKTYYPELLEQ